VRTSGWCRFLGGEAEQLRFIEQVGFCLAYEKRLAAAHAASVAWQRNALLAQRAAAQTEVEVRYADDALYSSGPLRRGLGFVGRPDTEGEGVWVSVKDLRDAGTASVWDLVTGDPAESFIAEGSSSTTAGTRPRVPT
jgi:hypothetical protein